MKKMSGHGIALLIGFALGSNVIPAISQQVGQKMFVGSNSQKEFDALSSEKKLATLNRKLDYLIQKSLPVGYYIDDDGVVQTSIRGSKPWGSTARPVPSSGSVKVSD